MTDLHFMVSANSTDTDNVRASVCYDFTAMTKDQALTAFAKFLDSCPFSAEG